LDANQEITTQRYRSGAGYMCRLTLSVWAGEREFRGMSKSFSVEGGLNAVMKGGLGAVVDGARAALLCANRRLKTSCTDRGENPSQKCPAGTVPRGQLLGYIVKPMFHG
jgi:hypothetical protein